MKRWDVFDFLLGEARSQRLRFRLEKDTECDIFYFDDPLQCSVDGRHASVALAIVRAQGLQMDVILGNNLKRLKLNVNTVRLEGAQP